MFVARERELAELGDAYETGSFQMAVVYGRRRVGKTALLRQFVSDKKNAIFFTARQTVARENLEALSAALATRDTYPGEIYPGENVFPGSYIPAAHPVYQSFSDALLALFRRAQRERVVFVIDEYPYLAESEPSVSSVLQSLIDEYGATSKLFLVLCGSSMSFMKEQVLGEKSPLYGRRTLQIELKPFDVFDSVRLLGTADPVRSVELYALVGGVPQHLRQLDASRTTEWNIANRLLGVGAYLSEEADNFLSQEVRSPAAYNAIIAAIAGGCVRPQEIADRTQIRSPLVQQYLVRLEKLALVRRVVPVVGAKKRQVRYEIADNLFRFRYHFGTKYALAVDAGMGDMVAREIVGRELSTFVGPVFEDVARQWLVRQMAAGAIDVIPLGVGTWWGTNPRTRHEEEIDVVVRGTNELLLGECKWTDTPVDSSVLGTLRRRASLLDGGDNAQLYLFSKSGFEAECVQRARSNGGAALVTVEEMFSE